MTGWTLKPASTPANPKLRTVPELLAALPDMLEGVVELAPEFIKGLKTLCNVSAPSDVRNILYNFTLSFFYYHLS